MKYITPILFLLLGICTFHMQAQPACDRDRSCIGRAVQMSVNTGRGAHFVEVTGYSIPDKKQTAMTLEMWVKVDRLPNTVQFLGGLWGPGFDNNDSWQLYINQSNELVFEVNGDGTKLRGVDNTKTSVPFSSFFGKWTHVAAIFDGSSNAVSIYLNSELYAGPTNNPTYPVSYLRPPEKQGLRLMFGSTNGLSDNTTINRTFRGQMDEIRLWNRVLTPQELYCNMSKSLAWNTPNLTLYYRCNEADGVVTLCDATGKNFVGTMFSGTKCVPSDRTIQQKVIVQPASLTQELQCIRDTTFVFTITDTSVCGSGATFVMDNVDRTSFTISRATINLLPNQPDTISVRVRSSVVGPIIADLKIRPTNACGREIVVPIRLNRKTEFSFPRTPINFDTLYVGCPSQTYKDTTYRICNVSDSLGIGRGRPVRIESIFNRIPGRFSIVSPSLPATIPQGSCVDIVVRFRVFPNDTSTNFFDTLTINTNDRCEPNVITVPVKGVVREVLSITNEAGNRKLDSIKWGVECINTLSNPSMWVWKNLTSRPITIDTIIVPQGFTGRRLGNKPVLNPNTGYSANYFRFFPQRSGVYKDSAVIRYTINGINCTFEKKVYLSGTGYEAKVRWTARIIDSGDCIVGQQKRIIASIKNEAVDPLNISFYFEVGEVFFFPGGRSFSIAPGETKNVSIDFKPLKDSQYVDKLCLFETRCFTTDCIQVKGRGVLETFKFDPIMMKTENVLGCGEQLDTLDILNIATFDQRVQKFSLADPSGKYSIISPPNLLTLDTIIPRSGKLRVIFKYTPNDITKDRADRAFLNYESNTVKWSAPLYGTSANPKLFLTPLTTFGTIEVSDTITQTVLVENVSFLPVRLDSLTIPQGFSIVSSTRAIPTVMAPRDSILVKVRFQPDSAKTYTGQMTAYSDYPCPITEQGSLTGRGIIIPLDIPISLMNWGYTKPCDCVERRLPLVNKSIVHPMTVDSLIIDSTGIPNGTPQFWSWQSTYSPNGTLPIIIPKDQTDTVRVLFCPRTPAEDKYINCAAQIRVKAHGPGWERNNFRIVLAGKRALTYKPEPISITFPPTPVDTTLNPQFGRVTIPSFDKNPNQFPIVIDSISFSPDERVFTAAKFDGTPFEQVTLRSGDTLKFQVNFKPRAPRLYQARVVLHVSQPCAEKDTTILVSGLGQANPFGMSLTFDNLRITTDTFPATQCDTLRIPVYASRDIPADLIDIHCGLEHDTTQLQYIGVVSPYSSIICDPKYPPSMSIGSYAKGTLVKIKNFCNVDSTRPIFTVLFESKTKKRASMPILIDSMYFDTEKVILYRIYAEPDTGRVLVRQSSLKALNTLNYDSVRILDCVDTTLLIVNDGDLPIKITPFSGLPKGVSLIGSTPPIDSMLQPNDTMQCTIRFCPRSSSAMNAKLDITSLIPCSIGDSSLLSGIGFAPNLQVPFSIGKNINTIDTVSGTLGDKVKVPLYIGEDFSTIYRQITYYLQSVSFGLTLRYNPYALKYESIDQSSPKITVSKNSPGALTVQFTQLDSVKKGELANVNFTIAVPDSAISTMYIEPIIVTTDSLPFVNIIPLLENATCIISARCKLHTLTFDTELPTLMEHAPNPATNKTEIRFSLKEKVPYTLSLYASDGSFIKTISESLHSSEIGEYSEILDVSSLSNGTYFYVLEAGSYRAARKMEVIR
ncbi:MAG: LamG-like jellyroll fold domain-containing protein [Bacteroidota bacterium]